MQFNKQEKNKVSVIACSLLLTLLSFNLSAALYKITDRSADVSFYFLSKVHMNSQEVHLCPDLLRSNGFEVEEVTAGPLSTNDPLVYMVSGGASLSQETDMSVSRRELTRNRLPAFRIISTSLHQQSGFQQEAQPDPGRRVMHLSINADERNYDLASSIEDARQLAERLQTDGIISGWHFQMPYYFSENELVIRVTLYEAGQEPGSPSEATTSEALPEFRHRNEILNAFGSPVNTTPSRSFQTEQDSLTLSLQLRVNGQPAHLHEGSIRSPEYANAAGEGRLSYGNTIFPKIIFMKIMGPDGSFTWKSPQHFILRVEFDSPDDQDITVPVSVMSEFLGLGFELDSRYSNNFIWHYTDSYTQRVSPERVVVSFMFDCYFPDESRINLERLQSEFFREYARQGITRRFVTWEPMLINTASMSQLLDQGILPQSAPPSRENQGFRAMVRSFLRRLAYGRNNGEQGLPFLRNENEPSMGILRHRKGGDPSAGSVFRESGL